MLTQGMFGSNSRIKGNIILSLLTGTDQVQRLSDYVYLMLYRSKVSLFPNVFQDNKACVEEVI